jgi:hypothetical protein
VNAGSVHTNGTDTIVLIHGLCVTALSRRYLDRRRRDRVRSGDADRAPEHGRVAIAAPSPGTPALASRACASQEQFSGYYLSARCG